MSSFKDNGYAVVRNVLTNQTAKFLEKYFLLKRKVYDTLQSANYLPPNETIHGYYQDGQCKEDVFCIYGDPAFDNLFDIVLPVLERETGLNLLPTYTYGRIYRKGSVLTRHKDRPSCEISATMNLGGPSWPIYLDVDKTSGYFDKNDNYYAGNNKGIEINLNPGDLMIYRGCDFEHWREEINEDDTCQIFIHFIDATKENVDFKNVFDSRPHLGLNNWFSKK